MKLVFFLFFKVYVGIFVGVVVRVRGGGGGILYSSFAGNSGHLTWVRLQQPQEQRYPELQVYAVGLLVVFP